MKHNASAQIKHSNDLNVGNSGKDAAKNRNNSKKQSNTENIYGLRGNKFAATVVKGGIASSSFTLSNRPLSAVQRNSDNISNNIERPIQESNEEYKSFHKTSKKDSAKAAKFVKRPATAHDYDGGP